MYLVPSSADRATSQMQGAAGTMSAMTKKQGTETKNPSPGIGQFAMNGLGTVLLADAVGDTDLAEGMMDRFGRDEVSLARDESKPPTAAETYIFGGEDVSATTSAGAADPGTGLGSHLTEGMTPFSAMDAAPPVTVQNGSQLMTGGASAMGGGGGIGAGTAIGGSALSGLSSGLYGASGASAVGGIGAGSAIGGEAVAGLGGGLYGATAGAGTASGIGAGTAIGGEAVAGLSSGLYGGGLAGGAAGAGAAGGAQAGSAAGPWGAVIGAGIGLIGSLLFS